MSYFSNELQPCWPKEKKLTLLACSGGADSVALLHLACRDGWRDYIRVICFDHQLRLESAQDAAFVQQLCEELEVCCKSITLNFSSTLNLQEQARNLRYEYLAKKAKELNCSQIFLGHHADDQAETILLHLLRGSGINGLVGMRVSSLHPFTESIELWRPLLGIRRKDIVAWLKKQEYSWREDSSNASLKYARNRVRHQALPVLAQVLERDPVVALTKLGRLAAEDDLCLEEIADSCFVDVVCLQNGIDARKLNQLALAIQRRVARRWLQQQELNPSLANVEKILALALAIEHPAGSPAKTELEKGCVLRRSKGWVQLG